MIKFYIILISSKQKTNWSRTYQINENIYGMQIDSEQYKHTPIKEWIVVMEIYVIYAKKYYQKYE